MALVLTDLGTSFKLAEFGREMAVACAAPLAGGVVAGNISTEVVMAHGRTDLTVYVSGVVGFQVLLGGSHLFFLFEA